MSSQIYPEPAIDRFDELPDSLLLLIFNNIGDVKSLGRCASVSRRFHSLIPQTENILVRVDCVISDQDSSSADNSNKSPTPISNLFRIFYTGIFKPIQSLTQFFVPKRPSVSSVSSPTTSSSSPTTSLSVGNIDGDDDVDHPSGGVITHHSPTQVLKNFTEIRFLKIELPAGELGLDNNILLRWRAEFGSTLHNCVMLGASSITYPNNNNNNNNNKRNSSNNNNNNDNLVCGSEDNGSIPESFYTNGGLKLRVVWTISSLIAASARHYLLQQIICEHKTLNELVLSDVDGQGVLCMNREQLEELRVRPLLASSASKRTMVPALSMRLWYAPCLELDDGTVLKGATLVCTRPSEGGQREVVVNDGLWVCSAFEEPFGTAARMLIKRRTYCLEMNSF